MSAGDVILPITGGCNCGAVRFEVAEPFEASMYCHCTRCQRRTGTAASPQARIDGRALEIVSGAQHVTAWRHPDGGFEKCFCAQCGSHLFSRDPDGSPQMSIRMAAFDEDPGIPLTWRAFTNYAASWEPIPDDGLERFGEARPRDEL